MAHSTKEYMREYMREYRKKNDVTGYMRKYRARKKVEAKNLEANYHRLYHENIELKKMLKEAENRK